MSLAVLLAQHNDVVVLDVDVDVAYVPPVDVLVAVEEAVDGRIAATVETGEFDFLVNVGI